MKPSTRREVLARAAAAGAGVLGVAAAAGQDAPAKTPRTKCNCEPVLHSKAGPDDHGPRELFAVVDAGGSLRRGMHVARVVILAPGIYEVVFRRDVRRGVYLATIGGHSYEGLPPTGYVSVEGRATNPRSVLVATANAQGENVSMGFHLLIVCPDGYA
jgi:hypothetical protein